MEKHVNRLIGKKMWILGTRQKHNQIIFEKKKEKKKKRKIRRIAGLEPSANR